MIARTLRLAVPDLISPSYFPAIAAADPDLVTTSGISLELGLHFPVTDAARALREGEIDFLAGAAHAALYAFPEWCGVRLLAALSQHTYWFLVVGADGPSSVAELQDLRIGAAPGPDLALRALLADAGIDPAANRVSLSGIPGSDSAGFSFGVAAADALAAGQIDAFWANGMGAKVAVDAGVGRVLVDARREPGRPWNRYTFAALMTTERLIANQPDAVAAVVRAVIAAQRRLRQDPALATAVARPRFPSAETSLIAQLVARDSGYYSPRLSAATIDDLAEFTHRMGLSNGVVTYSDVVASQFAYLWDAIDGVMPSSP